MTRAALLSLALPATQACAQSGAFELIYDVTESRNVSASKPIATPVGRLRLTLSPKEVKLVSERPGSEERLLYGKESTFIRDRQPRSDLAEIRPPRTTGLARNVPVFPQIVFAPGSYAPEFVRRPDPPAAARAVLVLMTDAVSYGGQIPFQAAEEKTTEFEGKTVPASYTQSHKNQTSEIWSYPAYRAAEGHVFPTKIIRQRFKVGGVNNAGDDETVWTLVRAKMVPQSQLELINVLDHELTVQDNRQIDEPVAFSYDSKAGSLFTQAARARLDQAAHPRQPKLLGMSPLLPIGAAIVGLVGIVVCAVALRARPLGRE